MADRNHRHSRSIRTAALAASALAIGSGMIAVASARQETGSTAEAIESARATLERWVETRRIISKEAAERTLGRELLEERMRVVEADIAAVKASIAEAEAAVATVEAESQKLVKERETLADAAQRLAGETAAIETRTKELIARLPDPVREKIRPFSQLLPEDSAASTVQTSKRLAPVVGILNEINKFQRNIAVESEVRTLADGSSVAVTTVYLGLGHAFYVSDSKLHAGIGSLGAQGWTWTPRNESANEIATAIAILKDEQAAAFVRLPVTVQ